MNRNGFTLVEMVVVVVIIGILAALAIPRFMGSTNKAKVVEFKPILKQIVTLQLTYKQEKEVWGDAAAIGFSAPVTVDATPTAGTSRFKYSVLDATNNGIVGSATPVNDKVLKDMNGKPLVGGSDIACADTLSNLFANSDALVGVSNLTKNLNCK